MMQKSKVLRIWQKYYLPFPMTKLQSWSRQGFTRRYSAMVKNKTYKSDAFAAIHETASHLYEVGMIAKQTMRHSDESCLTPVREFTPEEIQALREREHMIAPL